MALGKIDISDSSMSVSQFFHYGDLSVWLDYDKGMFHLTSCLQCNPASSEPIPPKPAEGDLRSFVIPADQNSLVWQPVLPDKSVLLTLTNPFYLLPEQRLLYIAFVPAFLWFKSGGARELSLATLPTVFLSKAWYGEFETGEMCYGFRTELLPVSQAAQGNEALIGVPLRLNNTTLQSYLVESICLKCPLLTPDRISRRWFTHEIGIKIKGIGQTQHMEFGKKIPSELKKELL